jgi:hypothetical protein
MNVDEQLAIGMRAMRAGYQYSSKLLLAGHPATETDIAILSNLAARAGDAIAHSTRSNAVDLTGATVVEALMHAASQIRHDPAGDANVAYARGVFSGEADDLWRGVDPPDATGRIDIAMPWRTFDSWLDRPDPAAIDAVRGHTELAPPTDPLPGLD